MARSLFYRALDVHAYNETNLYANGLFAPVHHELHNVDAEVIGRYQTIYGETIFGTVLINFTLLQAECICLMEKG